MSPCPAQSRVFPRTALHWMAVTLVVADAMLRNVRDLIQKRNPVGAQKVENLNTKKRGRRRRGGGKRRTKSVVA